MATTALASTTSWRSGTALFARPIVPVSNGRIQPSTSSTAAGDTAAMVARSIASMTFVLMMSAILRRDVGLSSALSP
jgi:hypothetical protein